MKTLVIALALSTATAFAAGQKVPRPKLDPVAAAAAAKAKAAQKAAEEGGILEKKGIAKGKVVFIDTQDVIGKSVIVGSVEGLDRLLLKYDIHVDKEKPAKPLELMKKTGATVAVIMVYDDETPSLLASPDERWAIVNFKRMEEGLKSEEAKKKFLDSRCSKQIKRGLIAACGGISSSFKGNIMSVNKIADLDLCPDVLPVDRIAAAREYMISIGMKPRRLVYYSVACEEGWAPAPTNSVQKKIWDEVHTLPSKPITIEPEQPKKK